MRRSVLVSALVSSLLSAFGGTASAESEVRQFYDVMVPVDASEVLSLDPDYYRSAERILYLNRCEGGETIYAGYYNDSSTNTSSIVNSTANFPEFPYSDATWNQVVADAADIYAPFDITVTDVDPGATPHHEVIVCGTPDIIGMQSNVLGVSPFYNCSVIEKSISFDFAAAHADNARSIAETACHEAGHAFGLEDEYLCEDPMTYLTGCGDKYFQDEYADCGGFSPESCRCANQQNSFRILLSHLGASTPTPPEVTITEPANNANVSQGFPVRVTLVDDQDIDWAKLRIDDSDVLSLTTPPYVFNAPTGLTDGSHKVEVQASDTLGAVGSDVIYVIIGEPCGGPGDCADGETCIDGRCVPGPDVPGGLGQACEDSQNCLSGLCLEDGTGAKYCTDSCVLDAQGCPSGFTCVSTGGSDGVCWPTGGDGGGGGCSAAGGRGAGAGVWLLLSALAGLVLAGTRPRRRRR